MMNAMEIILTDFACSGIGRASSRNTDNVPHPLTLVDGESADGQEADVRICPRLAPEQHAVLVA